MQLLWLMLNHLCHMLTVGLGDLSVEAHGKSSAPLNKVGDHY